MTPRVSWMVLAVVGAVTMVDAAPRDPVPPPDADFLEFLGSWHTGDDRWVDPFQVDDASGAERDEHNQDVGSRGDRERRNPHADVPQDESRQAGTDSTLPRRDVKP